MSEIQRKQANIRLLQRVSNTTAISGSVESTSSSLSLSSSREITDIVATATHVVLYEFLITSSTQSWTKCNIEGSLFLIQGNQKQHNNTNIIIQPYYQLIILNRTSTNNFICNVDTTIQIHDESPFIIVKQHENQSNGRILGFWFHNADERLSLYNQLQTTIQNITSYPTTSIPLTQPQPSLPQQQQQQASSVTSTFVTSTAIADDVTADSTATSLAALSLKTVLGIGSASNNDSSSLTSTTTIATAKVSPTTVTTSSLTTQSTPISPTNAVVGAATVDSNNQTTTTTTATNNSNNNTFVLDKKSLQLTLLSLIQDDRFIDLVHSQYLKVVRTRAAKTSSLQQVQQSQSQSTPSSQP